MSEGNILKDYKTVSRSKRVREGVGGKRKCKGESKSVTYELIMLDHAIPIYVHKTLGNLYLGMVGTSIRLLCTMQ